MANFVQEIENLLCDLATHLSNIHVAEDFNIHMESESLNEVSQFRNITCFQQHVSGPTYKRGHTLDLVITKTLIHTSLWTGCLMINIRPLLFLFLYCVVSPESPPKVGLRTETETKMDQTAFTADLKQSFTFMSTANTAADLWMITTAI